MAQITFAFTVPKGAEWHPHCVTMTAAQASIFAEKSGSGIFLIDTVNTRDFPDPEWSAISSTVWFRTPKDFHRVLMSMADKKRKPDLENIRLKKVERVAWWQKTDQIFFKLTIFDEIPQHVCLSEAQIVLLAVSGISYHVFKILQVSREHLTGPAQASPWVNIYDCGFKKTKDLSKALKVIGERIRESLEPAKKFLLCT